jgi:2-amino-4-hydroxy-6-hydroxymethyldihydropteridine diphosphokinase
VTRAVLSLGSNLGDRYAHLRGAVRQLGESVVLVSGIYETPPWGDTEQPAYLNAVVLVVDPGAGPRDWLERARAHERAFVLKPWLDLQPYARLPGHGWVSDLLNVPALAADAAAMTPRPDLPLESEA